MITDNANYKWYPSMDEAEQERQFKLHYNVTFYQFTKTELSLQHRCHENEVAYTPPQPTDSVSATKARRRVINRAIKTALQGKRRAANPVGRFASNLQDVVRRRKRHLNENQEQRQQRLHHEAELQRSRRQKQRTTPQNKNESRPTKSTKIYTHACDHKNSSRPCDCKQPPAKTSFAVMGFEGSQKFASSSTSLAVYCNNKNMGPLKETCYKNRYKQPYTQHKFSLRLDNTRHECLLEQVRFTEIWINEAFAFNFLECMHTRATINGDSAVIKHYLNPKHFKSGWGWEENIMLEVVCTGLPRDIIEDAKNLVVKWEDVKGWEGEHLYNLMSETTTIKVEFRCITFEEFTIRKGYPTYSVAIDGINNNIMTKKYGPNWRNTWEEIESEKRKKEEEERKRKYWKCLNGLEFCHNFNVATYKGMPMCKDCSLDRLNMEFHGGAEKYTRCINGYEICHDGIRQCPRCKDANKPLNPRRFKCQWCNKYFHSITPEQFNEHSKHCSYEMTVNANITPAI
jgi:hypothetical protein